MKNILKLILVAIMLVGCSNSNVGGNDNNNTNNNDESRYWIVEELEYAVKSSWYYDKEKSKDIEKFYYLNDDKTAFVLVSASQLSETNVEDEELIRKCFDGFKETLENTGTFTFEDSKETKLLDYLAMEYIVHESTNNSQSKMIVSIIGKYMYSLSITEIGELTNDSLSAFQFVIDSLEYEQEENDDTNDSNDIIVDDSYYDNSFDIDNAVKVTDRDTLVTCWTKATSVVKRNLKSPSSAKFPFSAIDSDVLIMQDGNQYCVISWVEADNSFGATIRSKFVVLLEEKYGEFTVYDYAIE